MRSSPPAPSGVFRYRALAHALWTLRTPPHFEEPRATERDVAYRASAPRGIPPLLDAYVPRDPDGASVVLVHGGGFVLGSKRMKAMRFLASRLVASRVAVCAIDYRLIFRGGRLEEALDDVRAALDFWRDRAERVHGLDPARVSLAGLSAGGALAMLAASRSAEGEVHRLACGFGLYEIDHLHGALASAMPRLLFRTADRDAWSARSPRHARAPSIPTLLLHGTEDGLVPVEQARRLAAHRESLGLPTRLVIYPDAPHGFFNFPCEAAEQGANELARHLLDRADAEPGERERAAG